MQVEVQLLSILRDCLPPECERGRAVVTLPEGATLADLVTHLGVDRRLGGSAAEVVTRGGWQVIVSGQYEADLARPLRDGDRVQVFPPVAGG
jgi:molybdopterin converting factor small subunit